MTPVIKNDTDSDNLKTEYGMYLCEVFSNEMDYRKYLDLCKY
ncbi:hypothetical protein CDAR_55511, partial [Caerostris darwini]